jgi:hypothetical protein
MKLISFLTKANAVRQAVQNPRQVGREVAWGIIQGYLLIAGFWVIVPLGVSAILGFTSWLGGPYPAFVVVFYLLSLLLLAIVLTGYFVYRTLKKTWSQVKEKFSRATATEVDDISANEIKKIANH